MAKIDRETAEQDFNRFAQALNISERKLNKLGEEKEGVIELIEYGQLMVSNDGAAEFILAYPIDKGSEKMESLTFKPRRLTVREVEKFTNNAKGGDLEVARRLIGALVSENSALLGGLDSDDFTDLSKISAFFLPR